MKTAEKRINKLKKTRIWPSIVLFVLSLTVGALLLALEFSLYAAYVVETKCMQSLADAQGIAQRIELRLHAGEDINDAVRMAVESLGEDRQILVLDRQDRILASQGEITADVSQRFLLDMGEEYEIYLDSSSKANAVGRLLRSLAAGGEGKYESIGVADLLGHMSFVRKSSEQALSSDTEFQGSVLEFAYWQSTYLENSEQRVLVRSDLVVRKNDLVFGIAITYVSAIMFLLIFTVQFMSVIRKILSHRRIEKLLMLDMVTGGDNWIAFVQKSAHVLEKRKNMEKTYALAELSLAKYQGYCSMNGIKAGEALLRQIDGLLKSSLDKKEIVGRSGSSEFALLLEVGPGENGKRQALERISALFEVLGRAGQQPEGKGAPVPPEDHGMLVFHAGVFFLDPPGNGERSGPPRRDLHMDELFVNAGIARASIRQEEGNCVACFSQEMWEQQLWEHKVEDTMQAALDNEEFQVYLQPKYNPSTGKLRGAEALVRWISPIEGMIPPGKFIPIFEKTGFVTKLDDYMISHVARLQSSWLSEGKQIVPVSVNISRAHFVQEDLAEHIRDLVDVYRVPHEYLEIELTESAFFDDKKALLSTVRKLQDFGFDVSMDDFGSGYSSLNSLKDLPLNVLKLDADFFRGDDFDVRGEIVVSKAIALAKQLNMRIVAEGVEKKEQVDFLAQQDCDMIQGYYYAKPMPAAEYAQRLE